MAIAAYFIASDRTHAVAVNIQPMFDSLSDNVLINTMSNSKLSEVEMTRGFLDEIDDKGLRELITYIDLKQLSLVSALNPVDWEAYVRVHRPSLLTLAKTDIGAAVAVGDFDQAAALSQALADFNRHMLSVGAFTIFWWVLGLLLVPGIALRCLFASALVFGVPLLLAHAYRCGYSTAAAKHYRIRSKRKMSLKVGDLQELEGRITE